ncbi:MAG: hypothetical protein HW388_1595 [Dehalococcoidia bacterium]|nr:hypothetical protein [Dehalococcoidia bacterium]
MAQVTSIQRRDPRSNQSGKYTEFNQMEEVDRLSVSLDGQNRLKVEFRSSRDPNLCVGLRMPREWSRMVSSIIDAVDGGAGTVAVTLHE